MGANHFGIDAFPDKPISELTDDELAAAKARLAENAHLREVAGEDAAAASEKLRRIVTQLEPLSKLEYGLVRAQIAKEHGITVSTLDELYAAAHPTKQGRGRKLTIIEQASDMIMELARLYTFQGAALASVRIKDHVQTVHVKDHSFRIITRNLAREHLSRTISESQVGEIVADIEARAFDSGTAVRAYSRIGRNTTGAILIDPGWEAHELIEVIPGSWKIVPSASPEEKEPPPIREEVFVRAPGYLPFPHPEKGRGQLPDLRRFINCVNRDDDDETDASKNDERFLLVLVFIVHCFFSEGPFTILVLMAESGSGKTFTTNVLCRIVDPHVVKSMSPPKDPRDMFAASAACWLLRYDNISSMPQWLSDLFCRFSTGGGTIERELYTNGEAYIFEAKRPSVVNGIVDIFHAGDALQRSLIITPPLFRPQDRRTEDAIWKDFDQVAPGIFADLLDLLANVLRLLPTVEMDQPLRMADFCKIGMAVEAATYGKRAHEKGLRSFMEIYTDNQKLGNRATVEASAIGPALLRFIDQSRARAGKGLSGNFIRAWSCRLQRKRSSGRRTRAP